MNIAMIGHKRIPGREGGVQAIRKIELVLTEDKNCSNAREYVKIAMAGIKW